MHSCMTTSYVLLSDQELRNMYAGKTKKEIINQYGPPTNETSDGGDGTILIYEEKRSYTTASYDKSHTYYDTESNDKYKWFYFDSKGKCTHVKSNCITKEVSEFDNGPLIALGILGLLTLVVMFLTSPTTK